MNWNIPTTSGKQPLQITLEAGDRLFMVGANGSGKSALIQHLVSSLGNKKFKRLSAHRRTWLTSGNIAITPQDRTRLNQEFIRKELRPDARWQDSYEEQKHSAVLFDLVAKENSSGPDPSRITSITGDPKDARRVSFRIGVNPSNRLNELPALGTLTVSLENSKGEEILAQHGNGGGSFSIEKMSDGERSAAIMAANVVTAKPATVFLIDEPERHLHRAIIEPFLSALFNQRKDCSFVVSTHEIALPVANPDARILKGPIMHVGGCHGQGVECRSP